MESYDIRKYEKEFTTPIIRYGRLTNLFAIPLCFIPSLVVWLVYGALPSTEDIITGWGLIASIYGIYAIIEPISYFPMVGIPGTYMVCLSGNISNVRIPCAAIAQESIGVKPGTKKAELVSTIGIAGSIVTNIIVVSIAAFGGATLMSIFPPIVIEAFEYVSPAIFGAMFGMVAIKNLKYGLFSSVLALILIHFRVKPFAIIPILVFGTIFFGFMLEKNNK